MEERIIELSVDNRSEVIKLPINPKTVEITSKQLNQTITLLEMGEVNLPGDCGLKRTKFSSFFPSENSPFSSRAEDTPKGYITMLDEWKTSKKGVRVIVTDMDINLAMLMDELNYSGNEGDEDIYYTMSFSEYVTLNVPTVNITPKVRDNGLTDRPNTSAGGSHTVVSGDTLWGIAKKYYGNGAQYTKIYGANSGTIEAAAKSHGKSNSGNGHWIYPGTVLSIPA